MSVKISNHSRIKESCMEFKKALKLTAKSTSKDFLFNKINYSSQDI